MFNIWGSPFVMSRTDAQNGVDIIFNFRYNISFIDPPLGGFGDISLSDDIFLGAKPLGKYHHFGKYYAESPERRVYK
jgi:hypothetical protein